VKVTENCSLERNPPLGKKFKTTKTVKKKEIFKHSLNQSSWSCGAQQLVDDSRQGRPKKENPEMDQKMN